VARAQGSHAFRDADRSCRKGGCRQETPCEGRDELVNFLLSWWRRREVKEESVRGLVLFDSCAVLHYWRDDGAVSPNTIVRYIRSTICFCAGVSGPFSSSPMALSELW
jgi:hypothetical protein